MYLCFALLPLVFRKFIIVFFTSCGSAWFNLTLFCKVAGLKVPAMIDYDVSTKVLDTEIFSYHTIADLISGITFIVLFCQEKPLR